MSPSEESGTGIPSRFERVRQRIERACARTGRATSEVTLVAVSKRQPSERIRAAVAIGQRIFGENQVQEALAKQPELPSDLEWHLIGPLQSNKVKLAASGFAVIHSLDRPKIARKLDEQGAELGRPIQVFVQVNIGGEGSKHGFAPDRFEAEVRPLGSFEHLRIMGLMAIPPYEEEPEGARRWFRQLRELRDQAAGWSDWQEFPGLLSMGMSHDFEIAIEEGATHVRVGTDLFGPRPTAG